MSEPSISTVSQFVQYVEQNFPKDALFRGQAEATWELIPSVQRPGVLPTADPDTREKMEKEMLLRFQKEARPHMPKPPDGSQEWEWLAIAQHHGLPTRLLDWTENAAAALFFAVETPNGSKPSAVWCTDRPPPIPDGHTPFQISDIHVYEPAHVAQRITVQRSCFTVHPKDYYPQTYYEWPTTRRPVKLTIPASARVEIRNALRALGVCRSSLFPDLDGIATEIKRRYCPMEDETHVGKMGKNGVR